ncbi:MAG: 3,4-dihydroxy-2-butanone 4-phosphate synthase / cyclohydrolase [Pseudomonadota bacterium]|jgi:GTP cyclohydrolase II
MFTYIDPRVREKLLAEGKIQRIDHAGAPLSAALAEAQSPGALEILGPIPLPLKLDGVETQAQWYAFVRRRELHEVQALADELRNQGAAKDFASLTASMAVNSLLVFGNADHAETPLVRVHSNCLTGDVLGSQRCECGPQLAAAVQRMANAESGGYLVYMAGHEGRGIGLWAKAATYLLQDDGEDTYQANRSLGLPDDCRDFADAAAILRWRLGNRACRLMTNNPKKIADLTAAGVKILDAQQHVAGVSPHNSRYLAAKRAKGHAIDADLLGPESAS